MAAVAARRAPRGGDGHPLLAKLLAACLGPVLAAAIGPEQTAFLPGRLIGDNITFLQLLPDCLRLNHTLYPNLPSSAALIFLDFRKAYDTVKEEGWRSCWYRSPP